MSLCLLTVINFDEDGNMRDKLKVLDIDEIEEKVEYALLLSTNAGAWRYLIGDMIKFINKTDAKSLLQDAQNIISVFVENIYPLII